MSLTTAETAMTTDFKGVRTWVGVWERSAEEAIEGGYKCYSMDVEEVAIC